MKGHLEHDGTTVMRDSALISVGLGVLVSVLTWGALGHIQKKTFHNIKVFPHTEAQ